jgi:hypothetical protein
MTIDAKIRNNSAGPWRRQSTRSVEISRRPAYTLVGDGCSKTENSFLPSSVIHPRERFT